MFCNFPLSDQNLFYWLQRKSCGQFFLWNSAWLIDTEFENLDSWLKYFAIFSIFFSIIQKTVDNRKLTPSKYQFSTRNFSYDCDDQINPSGSYTVHSHKKHTWTSFHSESKIENCKYWDTILCYKYLNSKDCNP